MWSKASFLLFLLLGYLSGATTANELNATTTTTTTSTTTTTTTTTEANNVPNVSNNTVITTASTAAAAVVPSPTTTTPTPTLLLPPELQRILPANYDRHIYNKSLQDPQITLIVHLLNLTVLEDQEKVNVSVEVEVRWTDFRLKPNSNIGEFWNDAPLTTLEHIWHPPMGIRGKSTDDTRFWIDASSMNKTHSVAWRLEKRPERISFSRRTRVTFLSQAEMDYSFFPNDKHIMTTFWLGSPIPTPVRRAMVNFESKKYKDDDDFDITVASTRFTEALKNDSIEYFDFIVLFDRKMEAYTYKIYAPSGLFVVLSFLSMLLPAEVAGERVGLCATTLLAVTVFYSEADIGKVVTYLRAIDIWFLGCTAFTFLLLFQSVIILRITTKGCSNRRSRKPKKDSEAGELKQAINSLSILFHQMQEKLSGADPTAPPPPVPPHDNGLESNNKAGSHLDDDEEEDEESRTARIAQIIDWVSLIMFLILLAICLGIYWDWLLNTVQQECPWQEQCIENVIDTDEYETAAEEALVKK